jgi:site-specific recombinase
MNDKKPHQSEIDELQRMFRAEDPRSKRPRFWRRKLVGTLGALNLTFILGVAIYLLAVYGWRLLQWLELRGR